jgi:predicted HTH domain antitoxin
MIVEIPDQILEQAGVSEVELLLKLATALYLEDRLTLGQASKLAGLHQVEFQQHLFENGIPVHYDEEDFDRDLRTLALKK